ncbi:hypothetical protein [Planotetraspora kaengkrachanensis]|uniref:Uncharacterized protein n=1 Tax=Planotetraspora kaengkrachanensis TaxID=575193 RepID=A0A8J3V828_9ACTN|nr:hypothetical protein [Planotetraspora kaengkrachanensis]GIG82465.1 hypothetical protein Pka01_55920 [Planotetraspora kaengkrachanensis]
MRIAERLRVWRPLYPPGAEEALALVIHRAFLDIRFMVRYRKPLWLDSDDPGPESGAYLQKIHMLSDLGDQLPGCLSAMVRRPRSRADIIWNLTYTWRTAGPDKRQWLREAFAHVGYDHRHLFPDHGDHDKYDQATMLGKEIRPARAAAEAVLIAQGYDKDAWTEDRWHTLEEIARPDGSRPHVIFKFSPKSRLARWRRKPPLTVAVDVETNETIMLA